MIKIATNSDLDVLTNLAGNIFGGEKEILKQELKNILNSSNAVFFLYWEQNKPVAFAQCGLRFDYVEGTSSSPVGYLEGIFVEKEFRNKKIAKKLLEKCEEWSKNKGATEFASDCELNNTQSILFHKCLGFCEVNRIVCFKKNLKK